jgi:hypothetical protein
MLKDLKLLFFRTLKLWQIFVIPYILGLLILSMSGLKLYDALLEVSQGNVLLDKLVSNFDLSIFFDFWRLNSLRLSPMLLSSFLVFPIIWVIEVFFTGGKIDAIYVGFFRLTRFLIQSKKFFWRNLRLALVSLVAWLFLIVFTCVAVFFWSSYMVSKNELEIFLIALPLVLLISYIGLCIFLSKKMAFNKLYETENQSVSRLFKESFRSVLKSKVVWLNALFFIGMNVLLIYAYLNIESLFSGSNIFTAFAFMVLQQVFILVKKYINTCWLGSFSKKIKG